MPYANTHAMTLHLAEISQAVDPGAHAVVILDQAGWHTSRHLVVPDNITLLLVAHDMDIEKTIQSLLGNLDRMPEFVVNEDRIERLRSEFVAGIVGLPATRS